ncbi:MAG: Rieske 2Fe-2S domain-containing protein [Acidimicrobiia bacterium]|nr:Rieske 2Fe-2S domain-containing protein [Acidimicrobiia bacterium]
MVERRPPVPARGSLLVPLGGFAVSVAGAVALTIVYAAGGNAQAEGVFLALALGGVGFGVVTWCKRLMPDDIVVEDRPSPASPPGDVDQVVDELADAQTMDRRNLLGTGLVVALGGLGVAALLPIRSLGPRPGRGLKSTPYAAGGLRLVDESGVPVTTDRLAPNGVLTVFPEGYVGREDAQTLLLNLADDRFVPEPGREDWTVDGYVAYSKVCTHAGCPVGLFEERLGTLLCPCHQSTFDVLHGAEPVFGPATRPLPQLPLDADGDQLVARGDFSAPIGPGFWDRDR